MKNCFVKGGGSGQSANTLATPLLLGLLLYTGADPGFLKGGGVQARIQDFSQAPPPPLDIVPVTSSALRIIEKHPHSCTLGHSQMNVVTKISGLMKMWQVANGLNYPWA